MKSGFLAACLVTLLFPVAVHAAAPSFEQALHSALTETKPSNFTLTAHVKNVDSDFTVKTRGASEKGKINKGWIAIDVTGVVENQIVDFAFDMRFINDKTYIRIDEYRPDVFFTHWKGAKGAWYLLPPSVSMKDVQSMLPSELARSAAEIAPLLQSAVTRFQGGHSFTFSAPGLRSQGIRVEGKIDASIDNEYRFFSFQASSDDGSTSMSVDFKAQRQFTSVYVELPKGKIPPFPVDSLAQEPLLRTVGNGKFLDVFGVTQEQMAPAHVSEPTQGTTPATETKTDLQTFTVPGATITVRSREALRPGRERLTLVGDKGQNLTLQVRVVKTPDEWASVVDRKSDYAAGRGVLYEYADVSFPEYSAEFAGRSLDVMFFDQYGSFISSATMPKCTADWCPSFVPSSPATYVLETKHGFIRKSKVGPLWRISLDRVSSVPVTSSNTANSRFVSDREALRRRQNLNVAPHIVKNIPSEPSGNEKFMTLSTALAAKIRIADVKAVIASGTAAVIPMRTLYGLLKNSELTDAGMTYAYLVSPAKGTNAFKLLVDNYTLLSDDQLDVDRNGMVDTDEKPAVPGTVYTNALYTQARTSPVLETSGGTVTVYVPLKDGDSNIIAVLAVSWSAR